MVEILKAIWNWIVSIPQDNLLHEKFGALIALFVFAFFYRFAPVWACFIVADVLSLSALVLKEIYDEKRPDGHSVELRDVLWGSFGILEVTSRSLSCCRNNNPAGQIHSTNAICPSVEIRRFFITFKTLLK